MSQDPVVIIGGGISGLATAYFLGKQGVRSVIVEKTNRLGGLIKTDFMEGCRLEAGPDSFIATKPAVAELAAGIEGLSAQIIGSNDAARQIFIVRDGKLIALPRGMSMMVPGEWAPVLRSSLFSTTTKASFLRELAMKPRTRTEDVSIQDFVQDHFGNEVLQYVADPLLAGVYGGETAKLSAQSVLPRFLEHEREHGSLIRAVRRDRKESMHKGSLFLSFQGGMQTLTDAVAGELNTCTKVVHSEACSVERWGSKWRVRLPDEHLQSEQVVFACPTYAVAALLDGTLPSLASELDTIPYSSAILVTLVYRRSQVAHPLNGFGFLVPQRERQGVAAVTWISTKFPTRTPPELTAIRAFVVGDDALKLMGAPEAVLAEMVEGELRRLMGVDASPVAHVISRWPRSMPQYTVGHEQRRTGIEAHAAEHPGLFLTGNAYSGVGIPDCIRRAKSATEKLISELP